MNKFINVIIISFFAVLTVNSYIGYCLYLPVLYFLSTKNLRNLIFLIPISIVSIYFFKVEYIISLLIINVILITYIIFFRKKKNLYIDSIYIITSNIIVYLMINSFLNRENLFLFLLCNLISVVIYLFFKFNMECVLKNKGDIFSSANIDVILFIICIFGCESVDIGIKIGLILGAFFIMYLSSNGKVYHSMFLSISLTLYYILYLKIYASVLLPFIGSLYILNGLWGSIISISVSFIIWISNQNIIEDIYLQGFIYTSVFFELCRYLLVIPKIKQEDIYKDAYGKSIEMVNKELIAFASFLDIYCKDFSINKEYIRKMNEAVESLKINCCNNCYMKDTCFKVNKNILYKYMSELLVYSQRNDYNEDTFIHLKKCPYVIEMKKMAEDLNVKYKINDTNIKNNALIGIVNGLSNIIRLFTVENTLKKEINYKTISKIKKAICDYGINICYFNPSRLIIDDFLIEVGVRDASFLEIEKDIERIVNNYITSGVSIKFNMSLKGKVYINIIPKIKYEVEYGSCNYCTSDNNVSGDNYLIKELSNTKTLAVICDGMGKGYEANYLSDNALKMIDQITDSQISSETSLQILNTFYYMQDYIEKYSTLDLLEIDKVTGKADFYKLGATTTYIYHKNGRCQIVENMSLPFGLEEIVEPASLKLDDGSIVIMSSDGVFEASKGKEEVERYIKGISHLSAQGIVYEIMKFIKNKGKIVEDDMSIIVAKIKEC